MCDCREYVPIPDNRASHSFTNAWESNTVYFPGVEGGFVTEKRAKALEEENDKLVKTNKEINGTVSKLDFTLKETMAQLAKAQEGLREHKAYIEGSQRIIDHLKDLLKIAIIGGE